MKCFLGISNFLEEISILSHSVVLLCLFALITEEGFLISPCYSLELFIQMGISFLFSLPLASLLFSAIFKFSSDNHVVFLHFFFLGMVLITASCCTTSRTLIHSSSVTLSIRRPSTQRFSPWVLKIPWRKKWQLTPMFLSGKFHGQRSLAHNWPTIPTGSTAAISTDHGSKISYFKCPETSRK